jgi:guanyl-specific ribonuclease Sa
MSSGSSRRLSPAAAAVLLGVFLVAALAVWALGQRGGAVTPASPSTAGAAGHSRTVSAAPAGVRSKALYVLSVLDATGRSPSGYVGGRQFMNDGRGGTSALPRRDGSGRALTYHEYDVNPKVDGVDRGPERLVVGSDDSAYWTSDHYVTWSRLR